MRVMPPPAELLIDPDTSIESMTSSMWLSRVTSLEELTVMLSSPRTRVNVVGMVAVALRVMT
jgi:hypothetical protein